MDVRIMWASDLVVATAFRPSKDYHSYLIIGQPIVNDSTYPKKLPMDQMIGIKANP
jgi:hypothetical protein